VLGADWLAVLLFPAAPQWHRQPGSLQTQAMKSTLAFNNPPSQRDSNLSWHHVSRTRRSSTALQELWKWQSEFHIFRSLTHAWFILEGHSNSGSWYPAVKRADCSFGSLSVHRRRALVPHVSGLLWTWEWPYRLSPNGHRSRSPVSGKHVNLGKDIWLSQIQLFAAQELPEPEGVCLSLVSQYISLSVSFSVLLGLMSTCSIHSMLRWQ